MAATLVFSQSTDMAIPVAALAGQARTRFASQVTVLGANAAAGGESETASPLPPATERPSPPVLTSESASSRTAVLLEVVASGERGIFRLDVRRATRADVACAREAEQRGRAAGMGDLAARCSTVWSVEAEAGTPEWLLLELCAVLAFAALGPVLPPDGSTLLGVRSARERAERLRGSSRDG